MELDEDALKEVNVTTLKSLFTGTLDKKVGDDMDRS